MSFLNKLTYRYLKLNKKKCIATLVSIVLITILLFSVGIFASTIRKTLYDSVVYQSGTKHVIFSDIPYNKYDLLTGDKNIENIEVTNVIDIINDELYINSIDESLWDSININIGNIPKNTNEIVISDSYAQINNLTINTFLGEKIIVGIY